MNDYLRLRLGLGSVGPERSIPFRDQDRVWWGPLVRRVLGRALIDIDCPVGRPLCQGPPRGKRGPETSPGERCQIADRCSYGVLYASSLTRRPPFALHVPPTAPGELPEVVELTLLGPGIDQHPKAIVALSQALNRGLGQGRRQLRVLSVEAVSPRGDPVPVCGEGLRWVAGEAPVSTIDLTVGESTGDGSEVRLELMSPTRLAVRGRLLKGDAPVGLDIVVSRTIERLEEVYGQGAAALGGLDRHELESAAEKATLAEHRIEWVEVRDWSARKQIGVNLGGKLGWQVYREVVPELRAILGAASVVHLGKNPTSGCGRVEVSPAGSGRSAPSGGGSGGGPRGARTRSGPRPRPGPASR